MTSVVSLHLSFTASYHEISGRDLDTDHNKERPEASRWLSVCCQTLTVTIWPCPCERNACLQGELWPEPLGLLESVSRARHWSRLSHCFIHHSRTLQKKKYDVEKTKRKLSKYWGGPLATSMSSAAISSSVCSADYTDRTLEWLDEVVVTHRPHLPVLPAPPALA